MDTTVLDVAMSVSTPPVELPELAPITPGQSKPTSVFSTGDPLPPRSSSPPLPPRKNAHGLPPSYLDHLHRLLRQWLEQQVRRDDDGLPGQEKGQRLWDDKRVKEIESALWNGVMLPPRDGSQGAGLLGLDWNGWAVGAAERKRLWKEERRVAEASVQPSSSSKDVDKDKKLVKTLPLKRGSTSDPEPAASDSHPRLAAAANASHPATPDRHSPRPPSVASTTKDVPSKLRNVETAEQDTTGKSETEDEVEKQEAWYRTITSLRGYEALPKGYFPSVEDDEDTPTSLSTVHHFPGAFPTSPDARRPRPPPKDTMATLGLPPEEPPGRVVKPVFCVHFPSPSTANPSSSSLLLHRTSSVASTIRRRQHSSTSGKWWPSTGSQRSWTGLSGTSYGDEPIAVEFVPGKYSLPSPAGPSRRPSTLKARSRTGHGPDGASDDSPPVGSPESVTITEADEEGSDSETEPAGSRLRKPRDVSLIIGGGENDVPDQSVPEKECRVVGGTVVVSGLSRDDEQQALAQVLRVLLYTTFAMILELDLLDAFRVPRELDSLPDAPMAPSLPPKTPVTSSTSRRRSIKDKGDKTKGFFNRLGRDTKGIFGNLLPRPRKAILPEADPPTGLPPHSGPATPHSTLSLPMSTPSSSLAFDPSTPISQTTDRHLRTLQKLESMLPSTTPGLKVPMPSLLLRVKEEDRIRREKAKQELEDGSVTESRSFFLASASGATAPAELRGRAMGYRMGGDVRAGLGALVSGMDTFEGWIRLQRLEMLSCSGPDDTSVALCEAPNSKSAIFWDESTDQSIDEFTSQSSLDFCGCESKECKVDQNDHVRWLLHCDRRIGAKFTKLDGEGTSIDVWTKCIECGASTSPRQLGDVGRLYSFSKLLELFIYNHPLQPNMCKHPSHQPKYLRYIRGPSGVLMLYVEPVTVLDTRLPKLQVGPNVGKRKPGLANAEAAVDGLMSRERKESQSEELKGQIKEVFGVLVARLNLLQRYIQAERDTGPADEMENRDAEDSSVDPLSKAEESLAALLKNVQGSQEVLSDLCTSHPSTQLNDIRQKFKLAIREAQGNMAAWQKDHDVPEDFNDLPLDLPDYFGNEKIHALPGSSILIREDEPSSVFAYALSSLPYFLELASGHKPGPTTEPSNGATETITDTIKTGMAEWEVEVKRRDAPRDLLSLRALTKKRSEASMAKLDPKVPMTPKPNQPSLELSLEQVEGTMSKSSLLEAGSRPRSPSNSESEPGYATPRVVSSRMARRISDSEHQSSAPPSSFRPSTKRSVSHTVPPSPKLTNTVPLSPASRPRTPDTASTAKETWSSSVTGSLTSSFNTLLRLGSDMGSIRMRGGDRALTSLIGPLSMMSAMDNSLTPQAVLDKPHLQFTYTLEDRLKIGCTIYYATAFDSLRRRCAIDRSMIASLARCDPWEAQGGKSKASFFMTRDKRYIIKQLVSKWNVSDTQALMEIAPVYFEHLAGTHNRATALTKIVGFYTFKLNDLKNGQKTSMDLLVMENLFYKQDIAQRFDLKGIEGRKAPKGNEAEIQFDSEWLEGQTRSPILLYPHAKRILQEAISLDTRFLSRESIMDYSLLLGLDKNKKELVVGLVDAIGSYNLFKTIESRGKLALNRGGEVTIIPPDQYRERFENAIRQYFIACPDKWSKTSRRNPPLTDTLPPIL